MPIHNKTIFNSAIALNNMNQEMLKMKSEVDALATGDKQRTRVFDTEEERDIEISNPTHGDWCYVLQSTLYNTTVQYIYDITLNDWKYIGNITNISDATTDNKGIIKLSGDLSGSASLPQLKTIISGGTYSFGNNTVTLDSKGRIINVISGTTSYEWVFTSPPNTRSVNTRTLTVPNYNISSASLHFYYNGFRIPELTNFTRINSTTIQTTFTISIDDDILIENTKFIGKIDSSSIINDSIIDNTTGYSSNKLEADFAKLTDNIEPIATDSYNIGSPSLKYDNIYLVNAPTVLSDPKHKRNIERLKINALEFVNALEAYQYKILDSGNRIHTGLLTTQLKSTLDYFDVDYAMYVKDIESNEEAIRYEELISVLIRAISQATPWYKKLYYKFKKYIKTTRFKRNEVT